MPDRFYIAATAGHVDHGKSALIKALTGIDPDRLPEEKARGITIDLGFAHLDLPFEDESGSTSTLHIGIVDVPGHEDFVKNMVAGVGAIDLALFIVAADDGWMPQSEEHLQILSYLGVQHGVVALTKADLADGIEASVAQVRSALAGSNLEHAPIVPTSVVSGEGLEELKNALREVLHGTRPQVDIGKPRLTVDRVFSLRGIGTVATGTLTGGTLRRGQEVVIQPHGKIARIRNIQSFNRDVEASHPGMRTAINLPDIDLQGETQQSAGILHRGAVVALPSLGGPCREADVLIERSARLRDHSKEAPRPFKSGATVKIHCGTACGAARVAMLDQTALGPGERVIARLRFDAPVFLFAGDRFIVRDWPGQATLAGGIVLDPDAAGTRFNGELERAFLKARSEQAFNAPTFVQSQVRRDRAVRQSALLIKSRFNADEVTWAVKALLAANEILQAGAWLLEPAWWQEARKDAAALVDKEHQEHPEHAGLPLANMRGLIELQLPAPEVFAVLVHDLCECDFVQSGAFIRRRAHKPALPAHLQKPGERMRSILLAKPFDPPSRKEVIPDSPSQQVLRFFLQSGEVVELGQDVVMLADAYAKARDAIAQFLQKAGSATVSELRQHVGTSRRVIVPLLERLDKESFTVRQGDRRILRGRAS